MAHSQTNSSLLIEIQTLKEELDSSKKTVNQYASSIAKLFVELENLRSSICPACKEKLVPGISASAVTPTNSGSRGPSSTSFLRFRQRFQDWQSQRRSQSPVNITARNSSRPIANNTSFRVLSGPPAVPGLTTTATVGGSHKRTTTFPKPKPELPGWSVVHNRKVKKALDLHVTRVFTYKSRVLCVNMSPDGQSFAIGLEVEGKTYINEVRTGSNICVLVDRYIKDPLDIVIVQFSPNGQLVVTVASDDQIRVWDITQRRMRAMFRRDAHSYINSIAFSPNGHYLVSGSISSMHIWNMRDGPRKLISNSGWFIDVVFSPDGRYIAAGTNDDSLWIWDARTTKPIARWQAHTNFIRCVKFTPGGKGLMSGSVDCTIKYWDASPLGSHQAQSGRGLVVPGQRLREIRTLEGHKGPVRSIAFFPGNTRWVLTCSYDKSIRVWDMETGIWQLRLEGVKYVRKMDVSRMGALLATVHGCHATLWKYEELQV